MIESIEAGNYTAPLFNKFLKNEFLEPPYNEFGKKKHGKCGYWQGTIIYLSLPLHNPVTLSDIELGSQITKTDIKINWQ